MKKEKNKKGISLIVLIITIIVIIILAAAVIFSISKNNPIDSAKEAKFKEDVRTFQDELAMTISKEYTEKQGKRYTKINAEGYAENEDADNYDNSVSKYIPSFTEEYGALFKIVNDELVATDTLKGEGYEKQLGWYNDIITEKEQTQDPETDGSGTQEPEVEEPGSQKLTPSDTVRSEWSERIKQEVDGVPIPKGFDYVQGSKDTGIVIKDENNNEFVWVVADAQSYVKDSDFISGWYSTSSYSDDTLPTGITSESSDVEKYGGFYISRYEAGIPQGDTSASDKTGVPLSKQGKIVWNNISYSNAKSSAESMITSNDHVQTGLMTGTAWDATCNFIEDSLTQKGLTLANSTSYGNYLSSQFVYTNGSGAQCIKPSNTGVLIPTASAKNYRTNTKNIYDLAGNAEEWTTEYYRDDYGNVIYITRGGMYSSNNTAVYYRNNKHFSLWDGSPEYTLSDIGFRVRLYIK